MHHALFPRPDLIDFLSIAVSSVSKWCVRINGSELIREAEIGKVRCRSLVVVDQRLTSVSALCRARLDLFGALGGAGTSLPSSRRARTKSSLADADALVDQSRTPRGAAAQLGLGPISVRNFVRNFVLRDEITYEISSS